MESTHTIKISDYDYQLPDHQIAQYPLKERDQSKLLVYQNTKIETQTFENLSEFLPRESLLIFNNTKVIQARLYFQKKTGATIEIFCLEPIFPSDFSQIFSQTKTCQWKCIVGNLKKWKNEILEKEFIFKDKHFVLSASLIENQRNSQIIQFDWNSETLTFAEVLESCGLIPIPPYLNRDTEESDLKTYQTVYSKHKGSVAAPTAGLHFTENVINRLKKNKIQIQELTLHVGAGTFIPVKSECIGEHTMHTEHFFVKKEVISQLILHLGNTIAVGTTSVRTLESMYWIGVKLLTQNFENQTNFSISQWEVYDLPQEIETKVALQCVQEFMTKNKLDVLSASTQIMIVPSYKFRIIRALITNFHQPKSTLLLLIAAFIGEKWKDIYKYALENNFRFLSYGDSSLLIP